MSRWSRGMIIALGSRGPKFKSRTSPNIYFIPVFLKEKEVYFSTKVSPSSVNAILRPSYNC